MESRTLLSPTWRRHLVQQVMDRRRPETRHPCLRSEDVRMSWTYRSREQTVVDGLGGLPLTLPYSGAVVSTLAAIDVDHLVPLEEALQSGGDAWRKPKWKRFQSDLCNLVPALPGTNRWSKGAKGVGEWVPEHNRAWYVHDYTCVKLCYGLTFDRAEADVIASVLVT